MSSAKMLMNNWRLYSWIHDCTVTTNMNKPRTRISVISAIKFWNSLPPSWDSRSSVFCECKYKLLAKVFTFCEFLQISNANCPDLVPQIRYFWWLQSASLEAWSRFIHINDSQSISRVTCNSFPGPNHSQSLFKQCSCSDTSSRFVNRSGKIYDK